MAARKGRPPKGKNAPSVRLTDTHRDKIAKSNILSHLIEHATDQRKMSATQVTAGLGLLKKCMPDMQAQSFVDSDGNDLPTSITVTYVSPNKTGD